MTAALRVSPNLAALRSAHGRALARRRRHLLLGLALFAAALLLAARGADIDLRVLLGRIGNVASYFNRILTLDDGSRVWTEPGDWLWGWRKWLALLGETVLMSYVGTLCGAILAFGLNFLAAANTAPAPWVRFVVKRALEFCRTVPDIVFALIFVIAFGLGPMAGVLAIAIHTAGALGKMFAEIVENIDGKPLEGLTSTGAGWVARMRFAVLPQVGAGFVSYTLLRFELNVRGAAVLGFVGAGGIGVELLVAVQKFYYSDVSAILLLIILAVFAIDIATGWARARLFGDVQR